MRKALKIFAAILVLLVLVLLAAPFFLDVNRYHDRIQSGLQQKLGRQVSLGTMHLKLIPFAFKVENAVIAEDLNFSKGANFAEAQQLYVTAELMPLLHGDVQVKSLELRRPKIELIKNPAGVWNFASLSGTAPQQKAQPQPQAQQQPANKPSAATPEPQKQKAFSLDDFKITDGQVALTDLQKGQKRAVYDHIDLRLVGYAPDKPFDIDLAAHLPGSGAQLIELSGKAGPINQDDSLKTPFKGSIDLDHVSMSALQRFLNSAALANSDAVATGKADLSNEGGKMTSSGSLKLEQARFNGNDLGYPIAADFDLSADVNSKQLNINKGNLKLGATPLAITGMVNAQPTPAQIDVRLKTSNVSIEEVARLAASLGVAFDPSAKIDGKLSADVRAQGSSKSPALNGSLGGRDLTISGGQLKSPVKINDVELALSPDAVRSNNFTASTGKTSVAAQFALTQYSSPSPNMDVTVKTVNADLGELLTMAKAYGVKAVEGVNGSGAVVLDLHAVGPMKGSGATNLSSSSKSQNASAKPPQNSGLQINGSLSGQDITISGAQLKSPVKLSAIQVALSPDTIRSNNFTASTGHTNVAVQFALSKYSSPSPFVDATVKTLIGDLGELLTIAKAYGVSAVEGVNGSGAPALDLHAVGPIKGAGAMNPSGSGKLQNATIKSATLTKPLQVRNADLRFTQNSAVFDNLNASIGSTTANGNLTARNFTEPQVQFALSADKINVVELKSIFRSEPQKAAAAEWNLVPTAHATAPAAPSLISRTSGTGTVSIGTVINDKLVLNNVKSNVNIDKGVIKLSPVTAEAYGGTTTGTIVVDARNTPMKYAV